MPKPSSDRLVDLFGISLDPATPRFCERGHPRPKHHSDKAACLDCAYEDGAAGREVRFDRKAKDPAPRLPASFDLRDFHGKVVGRYSLPKRLARKPRPR